MKSPLPYFGKQWSPGFTCWDFVREIYKREFNIELSPHPLAIVEAVNRGLSIVENETAKSEWQKLTAPEKNSIALFGKRGVEFHVAFMVTESMAFHLFRNASSMIEPLSEISKRFQTLAFYRHAKIH